MSESVLKTFANDLQQAGCSPKKLQLSKVGSFYLASAFDADHSELIAESATCGFSMDRDTAVTKALVEWMERRVLHHGYREGLEICQEETSDGIAAYPAAIRNKVTLARENALNEAIERYVWATWWDDSTVAFRSDSLESLDHKGCITSGLLQIALSAGISKIEVIRPYFQGQEKQVLILLGFDQEGGVFSGGACGNQHETENILERAFAELFRHRLAFNRHVKKEIAPKSFYEQRLVHFGSGQGSDAVRDRLSQKGNKIIALPSLKYDEEIKSPFSSLIYTHRCLFQNQPQFVAGKMERLCL